MSSRNGRLLPLFAIAAASFPVLTGTARADEYSAQWGLLMTGANIAHSRGYTGAGVTVGVMDSGVLATHPDLIANLSPLSMNGSTFGPSLTDDNGHGTHVTGIIAATANGVGMMGVAPGASVASLAIMDSTGAIENDYVARVLDYGLSNGIEFFNNSWGSYVYVPSGDLNADRATFETENSVLLAAARDAVARNGVLVFATGNDGAMDAGVESALPYLYPELTENWIAVTAIGPDGNMPAYANRCGVAMSWCITAPGGGDDEAADGIYSTSNDGTYVRFSGTSMATPHVTGALAIARQMFPNASSTDLAQLVLKTATDIGTAGLDAETGWGLLNLDNLTRTKDGATANAFANSSLARKQTLNLVQSVIDNRAAGLFDRQGADSATLSTNGPAPVESPLRYWLQPLAGVSLTSGSGGSSNMTSRVGGLMAGAEILLTDTFRAGAGAGYTATASHGGGDRSHQNGLYATLYGAFSQDMLFAEANAGVARFEGATRRNSISGTSGTVLGSSLSGNTESTDVGVWLSGRLGMAFETSALTAKPFISGRVSNMSQGSGTENGAGIFGVALESKTSTGGEAGAGVRLAFNPVKTESLSVTPAMELAYARDLGPASESRTVTLLGSPVTGSSSRIGRDVFRVNLGVHAANLTETVTAKLSYGGELRSNAQSHSLNAGLAFRF
ncbi:S8 family peptidase [Roseibium suaedae]|uniref:Serine protease, subtilisin family n=1 Tax=Roseibium suaedae TaxID=735517 RepID=A0A1M7N0R5_9HYPH|nr:S8 family serine peptidase [Roseibium suaedae]SHM96926.1 Serine protease, subtilisin family [Roseibium suaedae]